MATATAKPTTTVQLSADAERLLAGKTDISKRCCRQVLRVDQRRVLKLIKEGKLVGVLTGNSRGLRVSVESVRRYLADQAAAELGK